MSAPAQVFSPRRTDPLGVQEVQGWALKWYGINLDPQPVEEEITAAAKELVASTMPVADVHPAVGFVVLHRGEEAAWLLTAVWRGDILHQRMYSAPLSDPTRFEPVGPEGPIGCVWELVAHAHEREAFVAHVLSGTRGPDVAAYLSDVTRVTVADPS